MPRTVDHTARAVKRDAFIDVATRLIQTKGYEQMSIQDVLDELDVSRGAFYHYFDSKADLLEAVVDHIADVALATIEPAMADLGLDAAQKFRVLFGGIAQWKTERKELILALMQVWLSDDNAIVREKLRHDTIWRIEPHMTSIVRQGKAEGAFITGSPEATARVLLSMFQGAGDTALELFMARQAGTVDFETVERTLTAYSEAMERVLGARPGSMPIIDRSTLHQWFG